MKRTIIYITIVMTLIVMMLVGCSGSSSSSATATSSETSSTKSYSSNSSSKISSSSSSFTNKYGTATTKCAHSGCNNYIASSGDTNCCITHSNKCLKCKKYIDEDATYCMDCLTKASSKSSSSSSYGGYSKSSSSSSSFSSGGAGKCKYKVGGEYVCSKPATIGGFCKEHYDYLNDAYNSLFGN